MEIKETNRGFRFLEEGGACVVQESSAIHYEDAEPGSSCLWFGEGHSGLPRAHLDRDDVREVIGTLKEWLAIGRLSYPTLGEWECSAESTMEIPAPGGGTQTVSANSAAAVAWAGAQGKASDPASTVDREALIEVLAQLRADGLKVGYTDDDEYWTTLTLFSDALGLWRPYPSETPQEAPR